MQTNIESLDYEIDMPIPPHIHRHTQHLYTHGRPSRRADLAVVVERVLVLPSTTLPSAPRRHTQTSMARRRFLSWKKSSPFGGIRTHSNRDRDLGVLSPTAMRPPSHLFLVKNKT
jgi:hypothetical protein